ncbi:MAG: STAS/SEC14 domain-containing protein [Pseudomonadota bacterium]|nr:STAS/SEC14 domain-containing protein [Pseudomonadota bacterium]
MLDYELIKDAGIIRIHPESPLLARDFAEINQMVNRHLSNHGTLKGLLISTDDRPGWEEFSDWVSYLRIDAGSEEPLRIATVSDEPLASLLAPIADHFATAEVKQFSQEEAQQAFSWVDHTTLQ